eukprot:TRINITY_DN16093_c0_g3_i1.p1 TRINITY_DN16093_c0_g3~~TRINITY_DN16093_c0_g3_i1.p1  ORF type:complete len:310 (+),score=52.24 TRINITY_DN16093_c0_g3_i1:208-1137(+)
MMILDIYGHVVIICTGLPVITGLVYNLRSLRLKQLLLCSPEKLKSPTDALIQINGIQGIISKFAHSRAESMILIGIVNLHASDCLNPECPCRNERALFDPSTGKFSERGNWYSKDLVFLKHFVKQLYEDALGRFTSSAQLNISFSYYLFDTMKNLHASLMQLNAAERKELSLIEEFAVHRRKVTMEMWIKEEAKETNSGYSQITSVTEYEELLGSCQRAMEKVANFQAEFWSQVANQLPDMNTHINILRGLSSQIYSATKEVDSLWKKMSQINPNHPKALTAYGTYMLEIKHHNQVGYEVLDRYFCATQ